MTSTAYRLELTNSVKLVAPSPSSSVSLPLSSWTLLGAANVNFGVVPVAVNGWVGLEDTDLCCCVRKAAPDDNHASESSRPDRGRSMQTGEAEIPLTADGPFVVMLVLSAGLLWSAREAAGADPPSLAS